MWALGEETQIHRSWEARRKVTLFRRAEFQKAQQFGVIGDESLCTGWVEGSGGFQEMPEGRTVSGIHSPAQVQLDYFSTVCLFCSKA